MKSYGCVFCNDMRNIQPASYINSDDSEFRKWIGKARAKKKFILNLRDEFVVIDKCPQCGYEFTEEDYNSYM